VKPPSNSGNTPVIEQNQQSEESMEFDLSKPQRLLKDSARQFFARECKPERVRRYVETDAVEDGALWRAMAEQGWTGLLVPEEYGGLGAGLVELAAIVEEMGRACLPGPFLSNLFATALIRIGGTAAQRARYLAAVAAGELKATVAILEQSATWDVDAVQVVASRDGDVFFVSGRKLFVPDAATADLLLCVARSREGVVVLPVKPDAAGVRVERMRTMDGTRNLYEVTLEDVAVSAFDALHDGGDLGIAVRASIDVATVALCAEMVGGMQWLLDTTVEYAKTRQQFGRAIGSFQAVQHHCADMLLLTESSRSATYYAAWALTENDPAAPLAVSIAKAYCSDAFRQVANRAVQVHGGIGFTWEHDLQLYYKRAKSSETLFEDAAFHRERIAHLVVDRTPGAVDRASRGSAIVQTT
jgi:alkylation response protein AidB-like acyl-CoA dehydrogenase